MQKRLSTQVIFAKKKSCLHCQFLSHVLKALFFIKVALKLSYFCKKKFFFERWGLRPRTLNGLRQLGAMPPDPQHTPPHCEFLATRLSSLNLGKNIHFDFRRRPFFLLFIQFRRRNYVIFTKVLSHAKCVWSRLQKRSPMQNFTI